MSRPQQVAVLVVAPARLVEVARAHVASLGRAIERSTHVTRAMHPITSLIDRAHAAVPQRGVVVLAASPAEAEVALTLGADEVLIEPLEAASLSIAIQRAAVRAAVRERRSFEARTLEQIIVGLADSLDAPLTALALDLDALRFIAEGSASDDLPALVDCAHSTQRISERLRDLHLLAPSSNAEGDGEPIALAMLVDQVLRILGGAIALRAHIEREDDDALPEAYAPRRLLARTLAQLLVLALDSVDFPENGRRLQRLRLALRPDVEAVAIVIEARPDLESPPESAPIALEGTGRLSVLREVVRAFDGEILAERASDGGVRFVMFLPCAPQELAAPNIRRSLSPLPMTRARRPRVLLVDHDERVLRATARALADSFDAVLATGGEEALALSQEGGIDAAVIDHGLVDITAALLADELQRRRPELARRCLLIVRDPSDSRRSSTMPVLVKPIRREALLSALATLLADATPPIPARPLRELN